jgi:hypothetical protein
MDASILKTVGQIAGIGGLSLGVLLIVFREIIRKNIFPTLSQADAYRLLRLITIAVWTVAILGMGAWVYLDKAGGVVAGTGGDITVRIGQTKNFNSTINADGGSGPCGGAPGGNVKAEIASADGGSLTTSSRGGSSLSRDCK